MSDIPSNLSKWEPPRWLKVSFLALVVLSFASLYLAKIYNATVVYTQKVEKALDAQRWQGDAPGFTLKDAQNQDVSLASYRGKVVFVNFWATWCGPCREEMPSFADLARTMDPRDTVFLAISVDEAWPEVKTFLGNDAQAFHVLLDGDKKVADSYGTNAYPESFIVGKDGRMLYRFVGARDWTNIAAIKLLEKAGAHRLPMVEKS